MGTGYLTKHLKSKAPEKSNRKDSDLTYEFEIKLYPVQRKEDGQKGC